FIQQNGEKLEGYKYPITQVEAIQYHLKSWLQNRNLTSLPIYSFIVFANRSMIYEVIGEEDSIRNTVFYADEIPLKIMKLDNYLAKSKSGNNQLKNKITQAIIRECEDFDFNVLKKFGIKHKEILAGVHCPACKKLGMKRESG